MISRLAELFLKQYHRWYEVIPGYLETTSNPNQQQEKPIFNPPTAPKADIAPPKSNAPPAPRTSVWNKEGTIVGHSAKEIGAENKGRAMLEKMGWSAGMGLG